MKVLVACTSTADNYITNSITTLVSIKKLNPNFDYALYIDGKLPQEFKKIESKFGITIKTMRGDQNFRALRFTKGYPLVCCNIFKIHKLVAGIYDYVITVDGDIKGIRPIPDTEFTDDYVISGVAATRDWCKKTLNSGVLCFNVKKCIEFRFYEKLVAYFKKYNHLGRWRGDDYLLGWFVRDYKKFMSVGFSSWQYIIPPTLDPKSKKQNSTNTNINHAYLLHMGGHYQPWKVSCATKLKSKYMTDFIKTHIEEWIHISYEIFGETLKKYMVHCYNWEKSYQNQIQSPVIQEIKDNKNFNDPDNQSLQQEKKNETSTPKIQKKPISKGKIKRKKILMMIPHRKRHKKLNLSSLSRIKRKKPNK